MNSLPSVFLVLVEEVSWQLYLAYEMIPDLKPCDAPPRFTRVLQDTGLPIGFCTVW